MTQESKRTADEMINSLILGILVVVLGYTVRMVSLYVVVSSQQPIFWGSVFGLVIQMAGGLWVSLHLFRYAMQHRDMHPNIRSAMLLCATLLVLASFFVTLVPVGPR